MSVVLFDTHAFIKRLTAAGMPEAQAEVLADQQASLIDSRLATKADLEKVKAVIAADTKVMLAEVKADILKWVIGAIGFQTLVILGAVLALAKSGH